MTTTRVRASLCVVAAMAAVCAACGDGARRDDPPLPTVKIGSFYPRKDHPSVTKDLAGILSAEPLVAAAWDGRPVYKLAESVVESEDGRALTVTLRGGVHFHDGSPLTASAVRDLLQKKMYMVPEIVAIEAVDERHLRLTLRRAFSVRPEDLSLMSVDSNDDSQVGLRTGPFKVVTTDPLALEPFAQYYQGKPAVPRVEIREYDNHRAAWTGMMRHEVNFLHEVTREAIEFVEAGGDIRAYPMLRPYYTALVFNMRHPVLRRREVRVAINEAIDRTELLQNGMRGHGRVAEGPFWPHHWAYPHGRFPVSFNREASKLRLDAAGLAVAARPGQMPSRFAFTCLIRADDDRFERIAQLVQRQLYAIGIGMRIEPLPLKQLAPRLFAGNYEAFMIEEAGGRILSWSRHFWHSPSGVGRYPLTGYASADAALDRLQIARSDDQVREAVADVMHVMRLDPPAAFLVWPREARAADAAFDIPYEQDRDIFGTFWQLKRIQAQAALRP